jgi:hypothetical protein
MAADITYIRTTNEGFLYLSLLTGMWSRKIVGYHPGAPLKPKERFAPWTGHWRNSWRERSPFISISITRTASTDTARAGMLKRSRLAGFR